MNGSRSVYSERGESDYDHSEMDTTLTRLVNQYVTNDVQNFPGPTK